MAKRLSKHEKLRRGMVEMNYIDLMEDKYILKYFDNTLLQIIKSLLVPEPIHVIRTKVNISKEDMKETEFIKFMSDECRRCFNFYNNNKQFFDDDYNLVLTNENGNLIDNIPFTIINPTQMESKIMWDSGIKNYNELIKHDFSNETDEKKLRFINRIKNKVDLVQQHIK